MKMHGVVETPRWISLETPLLARATSPDAPPGTAPQRGVSAKEPVLFKGRFRVESTRLPAWDYRSNGYYFVTICTRDRARVLSEVTGGAVRLSRIGEIVAAEWRGIAARRRDVALDEWVVMPNHVHGIIVIHRHPVVETPQRKGPPGWNAKGSRREQAHPDEETQRGVSTVSTPSRLQAGSLGAVIGQFKSRSTKRVWRSGFRDFGWQPRFYDHIIRDDDALNRIRQYIIDNPTRWDSSEEVPENLWI